MCNLFFDMIIYGTTFLGLQYDRILWKPDAQKGNDLDLGLYILILHTGTTHARHDGTIHKTKILLALTM